MCSFCVDFIAADTTPSATLASGDDHVRPPLRSNALMDRCHLQPLSLLQPSPLQLRGAERNCD